MQNDLLRVLDPELHEHLKKEGIEPQLYGMYAGVLYLQAECDMVAYFYSAESCLDDGSAFFLDGNLL